MKLTNFGKVARQLRMEYDAPLKGMAEHMSISSAYLSGVEYGDKRLNDKLVDSAVSFFEGKGATAEELRRLRTAASESMTSVNTEGLSRDAKSMVAAFARALKAGKQPGPEIDQWMESHY